jgi:type I restriction enzyme S subunit
LTRPAIFAGYLIRINQFKNLINSQYLNLFLNSSIAKNHGNKVKTDGVNQSNINGQKLSNYPFPYCSIAEQNEIVNQLELKLSLVDDCENEISDNLGRAEALRQSILKKAFAGQLVPQDPNDEPAAALLARIRAGKHR